MTRRALFLLLLAASPALAQGSKPSAVDGLFVALKAAASEDQAASLEAQIRSEWAKAATPAVRLLLSRGARELSEGAGNDAVDSYDAALDLSPDLLEAWRGRAQARRSIGDYTGAVHDLEELLRREPRSFVAFADLSSLAEARKDWRGALAAWQKVLEISPRTANGQSRLADLRRRALGEEL